MDAEKNTSEQGKTADSSLELEEISFVIDGTNPSAGETPLSPSTVDLSSSKETQDDSTAKLIAQGEANSSVPPLATDESTITTITATTTTTTTTDLPAPSTASRATLATSSSPPSASSSREKHGWLQPHYHDAQRTKIETPKEIEEKGIPLPPSTLDASLLDRFRGSLVGMAIGDALGAHVEFRPHSYLVEHPVKDFAEGGTWGLKKGQFTDDTSMALCLAASLIEKEGMDLYDQLVKYKAWFHHGYMSSTGHCFDIGAATSQSLCEFERRQRNFAHKHQIEGEMDTVDLSIYSDPFDVFCSEEGVAGNGALMRLAPVPLFFYQHPRQAIANAGQSGQITHGDVKAHDACRYYAALIVAALHGCPKAKLLSRQFYFHNRQIFGKDGLVSEIATIANGSFRKKRGYEEGIRGKGYIVPALEAALWAFWSTKTFEEGALAAVNLGDDTDTTAAIYGQLAGAHYGYDRLDAKWKEQVYAAGFLQRISEWLLYQGTLWKATDGAKESLNIDFQIDADEREDGPSAQIDAQASAQPTATTGTEAIAPVQSDEDSLLPPAQTSSQVPVEPVQTAEEQATSPPRTTTTTPEQNSNGTKKGTEEGVVSPLTSPASDTIPPSPPAEAVSSSDAANEVVQQPAADASILVSVPSGSIPVDGTAPSVDLPTVG